MNAAIMILGCVGAQTAPLVNVQKDVFLDLVNREAIPKWSSYSAKARSCEITSRSEYRHLKPNGESIPDHPGDKTVDGTYVIVQNYGSQRSVMNIRKLNAPNVMHSIDCYNTRYSFDLRGFAEDKLILRTVSNPITSTDSVKSLVKASVESHLAGWIFRGKPLNEHWTDPNGTLDSVRQNSSGNYQYLFSAPGAAWAVGAAGCPHFAASG